MEASFLHFDKAKSVSDAKSVNSSESMLKDLLQSQEIVIGKIFELSNIAADQCDKVSEDLAV